MDELREEWREEGREIEGVKCVREKINISSSRV